VGVGKTGMEKVVEASKMVEVVGDKVGDRLRKLLLEDSSELKCVGRLRFLILALYSKDS
jgi:hypothetical protein